MPALPLPTPAERAASYLAKEHGTNAQLALEKAFLDAVLCERERLKPLCCEKCRQAIHRSRPP